MNDRTEMSFVRLVLMLVYLSKCGSTIDVVELQPRNLLQMQKGLGWPYVLHVAEGHEALLRVEGSLENLQSCVVTTPIGQEFDARNPPSNRYELWSDSCGVRVRSVVEADEGRWRINATAATGSIVGWAAVVVDRDITSYTGPDIQLLDGQFNTSVELTTLDNSYCVVAQPFTEGSLIPGHCRVTLPRTTRAVQGNWNVLLGLPGKVQELSVSRRVTVEAERLDTGYIREVNTNKLHIYCNILNTTKNVTFCRFQKTASSVGYNIADGLSDGSHSYYGDGFLQRDCGMTIENPTEQDLGTWRCSVGVQQWVEGHIQEQTPMQALISVGPETTNMIRTIRHGTNDEEMQTVFVQEDQSFTVMCRADVSLAYCWFQHPNGTQFTPVPVEDEGQLFWYTGESLQMGDCGITFTHATTEEQGKWICHMGPGSEIGLEITDRVNVRVTGPLAANAKEIGTLIGDTVTLYCHSANGNIPLDYCRFLTPTGLGFRIDSTVAEESAILGRYYFTPGRDLDYGDCSLTIAAVQEDDVGEWTCAALINEVSLESRDTTTVFIDSQRMGLSQAGIAGMVIGLLFLVVIVSGFAVYKYGWRLNTRRRTERLENVLSPVTSPEPISFNTLSFRSSSSSSTRSISSNSDFNGNRNSVSPRSSLAVTDREIPGTNRRND